MATGRLVERRDRGEVEVGGCMGGRPLSVVEQIKEIAERSRERIEQVRYGEIVFVIQDGRILRVQRKDGWRGEDLD